MRFGLLVLLSLFGSTFVGCGQAANNQFIETVEPDLIANIRTDLQAIEKSGRLGSGMGILLSNVRALEKADPDKGAAIKKGLDELANVQGEAKVKAKAKELLKLL